MSPIYDILYISRHQTQDVVAFARTTSVRTEMRCYRGDAGVAAMLEAEFSDIERLVIPLIAMLRSTRARSPGQRGSATAEMQTAGIDEMVG